ncbi:MAG: hypothetical protein SVU88_02810, partial [Candidatus Nanohaloarchaea archaeon]|nr:hypothetical protein [Candidatus Nanohaloarchaea archaeon]
MEARQVLATAALLAVLVPAAHAVEVERGVEFVFGETDATTSFAHNRTVDNITVAEDTVTFGLKSISVVHGEPQILNTTIWNFSLAETLNEPTLQVATDDAGGDATITVTGAVKGREYRVEQDNSTLTTVETGSNGQIRWEAADLSLGHNFTATLLVTLQNVTVRLTGDFDHPNDNVVIDDEQRGEGTYTADELDFGYAAFELGGKVAGIVPAGTFLKLRFDDRGSTYRFAQTQKGEGNDFLIPFTEGSHGVIEDRESAIQGSLFGSANFLGFPSPNFAYAL